MVLAALQRADATRYPDPAGTALRERLAAFHGVEAARIVVAGSASEFIFRLSAVVARRWPAAGVHVPLPGYGDYARAAEAAGLRRVPAGDARLVWHTEPASPGGHAHRAPAVRDEAILVIDSAYAPLRLHGEAPGRPAHAWVLMSPNKALGLTGVRGAYAIAPDDTLLADLQALAPSWPVGAHGVAMLDAWTEPVTQAWLADSLHTLRRWKQQQLAMCTELGWVVDDGGVTNFFTARGPTEGELLRLREQGVKLRDTTSMGLPGHVRLSVQPPSAQRALRDAWRGLAR
ncbi:aminotransferase class I/II-fold pyridoxal phosphate-dependent enzyme [Piscinibacter sp. HJYY11]|nr:aminotransferase class I/II-fold pyridoxal phosphate-dependent enzyme [Piscinibacter sp. HJYY11]